jgi:hypothetical protein
MAWLSEQGSTNASVLEHVCKTKKKRVASKGSAPGRAARNPLPYLSTNTVVFSINKFLTEGSYMT